MSTQTKSQSCLGHILYFQSITACMLTVEMCGMGRGQQAEAKGRHVNVMIDIRHSDTLQTLRHMM